MATLHKPVLLKDVMALLDPKPNQNFIDGTLGGGGHAKEILSRIIPSGKLIGFDLDKNAAKGTAQRLWKYKKNLIIINDSYVNVKKAIYDQKISEINGAILDLGLSSDLLQTSGRGFSFQVNEPLDMRFSPEVTRLTAEEIINEWPAEEIRRILIEYGEEKFVSRIMKAIIDIRRTKRIKTTLELVNLIQAVVPRRRSKINPATKTFQALRIAVNDELNNVKNGLANIFEVLSPGGRLAVITFHSLEDRIVKQFFKKESQGCICPPEIPVCRCGHVARLKLITKKPVAPSSQEVEENWRSRSAKLRVAEKIVN